VISDEHVENGVLAHAGNDQEHVHHRHVHLAKGENRDQFLSRL
jgi:hypothetical protein